MSSKPASAFCDSKPVVRLEDATQFGPWSKWAIDLFVRGRILEDVDPTQPHYPIGRKGTLVSDSEWWLRHAKQETIKLLKDDGISRPVLRVELVWDMEETTLKKPAFEAKEVIAMKANKDAIDSYKDRFDKKIHF